MKLVCCHLIDILGLLDVWASNRNRAALHPCLKTRFILVLMIVLETLALARGELLLLWAGLAQLLLGSLPGSQQGQALCLGPGLGCSLEQRALRQPRAWGAARQQPLGPPAFLGTWQPPLPGVNAQWELDQQESFQLFTRLASSADKRNQTLKN